MEVINRLKPHSERGLSGRVSGAEL